MGSLRVLTDPSESELKLLDYPRHGKEEHKPLRVYGKYILDSAWNKVMLRGFSLRKGDVSQWDGTSQLLPLTIERFSQLKHWGFNVVRSLGYWGRDYEPSEAAPGVYREAFLSDLEAAIQRAEKAGLYWIIAPRVSYQDVAPPAWQGWGRHYHLLDATYRARYCRFLEMLVDRFDKYWNVMFCPWHFPWHGTASTDAQRAEYYSVVTPEIVNAIRRKTDKMIFWSPSGLGGRTIAGVPRETGEYNYISPLSDKNVVYQFASYLDGGYGGYGVSHYGEAWDYDEADLETHLSYGVSFSNTHDVPLMVGEWGMDVHQAVGLADQRPVNLSRLDWLRTKLKLFDKYGFHWTYWILTSGSPLTESFGVFETVATYGERPVFGLIQALQRYDVIPHTPPPVRDQVDLLFYVFPLGEWCDPGSVTPGYTTSTMTSNQLRGHLIPIQRDMRFDRIGCYIGTAGAAGAEARLGIYNINPLTLYPTTLVLDAGTVDCTSAVHTEITINQTLKRGWYLLAFNCNDSTIVLRCRMYGILVVGDPTDSDIPSWSGWGVNIAYGALPNPYPAGAYRYTYRLLALRLAELL